MKPADVITVLRARGDQRLAKVIRRDGTIEDYRAGYRFDLIPHPVAGLDALHRLVGKLLHRLDCAVVFGGIVDLGRTRGVRRLAYPDPETGDQATLRAMPHQWCAIDMDGIARPDDVPASDLARCAALAIQNLPPAFHAARCIAQASAGHGIKAGCRLHLWYWLDRPTTGDELGYWLKGYPVDRCTFRPAQPIYVANPVFIGRADHLPCRIVDIPGIPAVAVPPPESLKPPERAPAPRENQEVASSNDVDAFIEETLARVRLPADGAKHYALRNAARLLGGIQAKTGFADAEAVRWLVDALPSSARDLKAAEKTVRWGLDVGRLAPVQLRSRDHKPPDPRRQEIARAAFRLFRRGVPSDELLTVLHQLNGQRRDPLPRDDIGATALWAAQRLKEQADAG